MFCSSCSYSWRLWLAKFRIYFLTDESTDFPAKITSLDRDPLNAVCMPTSLQAKSCADIASRNNRCPIWLKRLFPYYLAVWTEQSKERWRPEFKWNLVCTFSQMLSHCFLIASSVLILVLIDGCKSLAAVTNHDRVFAWLLKECKMIKIPYSLEMGFKSTD